MELEAAEKRYQKVTRSKGDAVTPVEGGDDDEKRLEDLRSKFDEVLKCSSNERLGLFKMSNHKSKCLITNQKSKCLIKNQNVQSQIKSSNIKSKRLFTNQKARITNSKRLFTNLSV